MANRSDGKHFSTTGRPPDGSWMDSGQMRPSWMEKEVRNTTDSGMGSMETRYGLIPPQPGGRKRHADDGTLWRRYADIQRNTNSVQWDGIRGFYLNQRTRRALHRVVKHRKPDRDGPGRHVRGFNSL